MTERLFPDFADAIEWNLVRRETLTAPETPTPVSQRLPSRTYLIQNSHVLIIGLNSTTAKSGWFTGGWASMTLLFLPSSTSDFPAAVDHQKKWLRLRSLNLVIFPKIMNTWVLSLEFPYWLQDLYIEVWRYDGQDISTFERMDLLETAITGGSEP